MGRVAAVVVAACAGVGVGFAADAFVPAFPPPGGASSAEVVSATALPVPSASSSFGGAASGWAEVAKSGSAAPQSSISGPTSSVVKSADPVATAPANPTECMKKAFPGQTFQTEVSLDFVCEEANPMKGAGRVRERIVMASGGKTSAGMKEWAGFGFYELAAYATLRGRCCPSDPSFEVPASPDTCESMEGALKKLAMTARSSASDEDAKAAVDAFGEAVKCVSRNNLEKAFGGYPAPTGNEVAGFSKFNARARGKTE